MLHKRTCSKERLFDAMTTPELSHNIVVLDSVIDHLEKQKVEHK